MNSHEEMEARQRAMQLQQGEQIKQQQEQKRLEMEARNEQRRTVVRSVLEPEALERLNRIGLVKPEKQLRLEEVIFANVQRGAIKQKIDEGTFVNLLQQIEGGQQQTSNTNPGVVKAGGIQFKRRAFDDDDSDIDLDNLE
jgi:programmed cell death protein 5